MLDVNNVYVYQHLTTKRQKDEKFDFDWDFLRWEHDRKRTVERRKLIFKTKRVR
jgi:hypothetical protein